MPFDKKTASEAGKKSKRGESVKTKMFNEMGQRFLNEGAEKFWEELMKLSGKDYINAYINMAEFWAPKLSRQDITTNGDSVNQIQFVTKKIE